MGRLTQLPAWQALQKHYQSLVDSSMQEWFADDPSRFAHFSLSFKDILFDFSKNRITADTLSLLCNLADEVALADKIVRLFNGNFPEKQPAFHTALRDKTSTKLPDIKKALTQMTAFTEEVRNKKWYGATGKPIRDIINIRKCQNSTHMAKKSIGGCQFIAAFCCGHCKTRLRQSMGHRRTTNLSALGMDRRTIFHLVSDWLTACSHDWHETF